MIDLKDYNKLQFPYTISLNRYLGRTSTGIVYKKKEAKEYCDKINNILYNNNIEISDKPLRVVIIQHPKKIKKIPKGFDEKSYFLIQKRQDLDNINKVLLDSLQYDKTLLNNSFKLYHNDKQIIDLRMLIGKPIEDGGIDFYYQFLNEDDISKYIELNF